MKPGWDPEAIDGHGVWEDGIVGENDYNGAIWKSDCMALYKIPQNLGKVRLAVTSGNVWVVWNGKQGRGEFSIKCKTRKQAEMIARMINKKEHTGEIDTSVL